MKSLPVLALLFILQWTYAQEPMRVVHCTAVPQNSNIINIYVEEDNKKWVGTTEGVFQIHSADNASALPLGEAQWALLQQKCGNANLTFDIQSIISDTITEGRIPLQGDNKINTAYYDELRDELWIGTSQQGAYRFGLGQKLQLIEHLHVDNSKLRSNFVNTIYIDRYDHHWIGTTNGVLYGKNDKWKLYEKNENIRAITGMGPDIWIMGDDILWKADAKNRWIPGDFVLSLAKGSIKDIRFDSDGRLWVASEIITRYDIVEDKAERFGPSNGFTSKKVNFIEVDRDDALWVGTADKGLFLIEKESAMTVSCEVTKPLSCEGNANDASLKVKVIGGREPYAYQWNFDHANSMPEGLGPGLYTVTVTDSEGREKVVSAMIERSDLRIQTTLLAEAGSERLANGSALAEVEGGQADYTFLWDNGETGETAIQLKSGIHTVTVTDGQGCTASTKIEITAKPEPKVEALQAKASLINTNTCPGDQKASISISVSGGQAPYQYQWNRETLKGELVKQLGAGQYQVTITDALGNIATIEQEITGPAPIQIQAKELEASSGDGERNGKASVQASGGNGDFTYIWDSGESGPRAEKLLPGSHQITVVDANNCQSIGNISISKKQLPELDARRLSTGQIIQLKNLYFEADSSNIETVSTPVLDEVYRFLNSNRDIVVEIGGHTNGIPDHEYCDRLSTARAKSVADYMTTKGIDSRRVYFKGYGKRKPIATNKTSDGRRKNQRVEVKILSIGSG
ncbi:MAG: OmpA family protein [Bacteroidota bacterium]